MPRGKVPKRKRSPTKAERRRWLELQDVGCIACRQDGRHVTPVEIHHAVDQAYRRGHDQTAPLCIWHHRGRYEASLYSEDAMRDFLGPSLALHGKAFRERYGTDADLVRLTDEVLHAGD